MLSYVHNPIASVDIKRLSLFKTFTDKNTSIQLFVTTDYNHTSLVFPLKSSSLAVQLIEPKPVMKC